MEVTTMHYTTNSIAPLQVSELLLQQWQAYIDASERTVSSYCGAIKRLLKYLEAKQITTPTRETILAYKKEMVLTLAPSTVQLNITAIRLFFEWAEQMKLYPNIASHIKGVKVDPHHKKDDLSTDSLKCILSTIDTTNSKGKRDFALFLLLAVCGLRSVEATRANIEDLRSVGNQTALYIHGKGRTDKTDFVVVPYEVEQAIRVYLRTRNTPQDKDPLFTSASNHSTNGGRLTTRSVRRLVKEYMKQAGFDSKRLTTHSLRHSAVTIAIASGIPLDIVQAFARHKNIATTMLYSHRVQKINNPCSNTIAGAITI